MHDYGGPVVFRNATAILLTAALALTASAAPKEIPPKLVDYAARARARLAPNERARVDALGARISPTMSVAEVKTLVAGAGGGASSDSMMACLMDYLKSVAKEVRENQKIERFQSRLALAHKAGKLAQEKAKIEALKREAEERFDHAMEAANKEMAVGIVSVGALSAAGGAASSGPATSKAPGDARLAVTPPSVRILPVPSKTPTKAK